MAITLPIDSSAEFYRVETAIENETFIFEVNWNTRDSAWYISLLDANENYLLSGMRINARNELVHLNPRQTGPGGAILVFDSAGEGGAPGRYDLGDKVELIYFPVSEL
jgi:hypothetical protein